MSAPHLQPSAHTELPAAATAAREDASGSHAPAADRRTPVPPQNCTPATRDDSVNRRDRRLRKSELLDRITDLETQLRVLGDVAPPVPTTDDAEKRWLFGQIEALQRRIRRLEATQEASAGNSQGGRADAISSASTATDTEHEPQISAELAHLKAQMDALSSSSSGDEADATVDAAASSDDALVGGGYSAEAPQPPTPRAGPSCGLDPADWADNPLWHSGPPSIGATDIGPMSLPAQFDITHQPERQYAPPLRPAERPEMALSLLRLMRCQDDQLATSTLLTMCASPESCAALRTSGGLPLVVQLIHMPQGSPPAGTRPRPNAQVRSSASRALHSLVHSQGDDRRARRESRVLRLLEQLREFTESLWQRIDEQGHGMILEDSMDQHPVPTVVALMKLSFDEEHRSVMCQLGGIYTVAELIQADHEAHGSATANLSCNSTRRFAGMTLTNLTFGDGTNKSLLCGLRNFMRALVAQLHSTNEDLIQVTASVLRNLSWRADAASKRTLREVGAVTALMQAAMAAERESTLRSVLSALWNLTAHCGMNKADICALDGALAFLVKALTYDSPSKTTAIVENGGGILRNVSSHIASREEYRLILREHSCLETLLHQLKSSSLTIVSNACGTLWNLSARCAQDQRTLWELGAVSMLRSLIHSRHQMIAMGSSAALKNLLSARPEGVPPPIATAAGGHGLPARRLRALREDLDGRLTAETCDNLDAASAGRPEARFLAAGPESEPAGRVPRSDSRDSVRSTLSDPGYGRRLGLGRGLARGSEGDPQLAAAVAQVARHAGVSEGELRRLLLRPRTASWTGSLPRICDLPEHAAAATLDGGADRIEQEAPEPSDTTGNEITEMDEDTDSEPGSDHSGGVSNHTAAAVSYSVDKSNAHADVNEQEIPDEVVSVHTSHTETDVISITRIPQTGTYEHRGSPLSSNLITIPSTETPPSSLETVDLSRETTSEGFGSMSDASDKTISASIQSPAPSPADESTFPEEPPESPSRLPSCLRQLRRVIPGQKLPMRAARRSGTAAPSVSSRPTGSPLTPRKNAADTSKTASPSSKSPQHSANSSTSVEKTTGSVKAAARQPRKPSDQPPGAPLPQRKILSFQRSPSRGQNERRSPDKSLRKLPRSSSENRAASSTRAGSGLVRRSPSQPAPSADLRRMTHPIAAVVSAATESSKKESPPDDSQQQKAPAERLLGSQPSSEDVSSSGERNAGTGPERRQPDSVPSPEHLQSTVTTTPTPSAPQNGNAAWDNESRIGRPTLMSRLPRPGSGLPRLQRTPARPAGHQGDEALPDKHAPTTWSVQQHHRRLGRRAAGSEDLTVVDLEVDCGTSPSLNKKTQLSERSRVVAESGTGGHQNPGVAAATGWSSRLCGSTERAPSRSGSGSSLSARSEGAASSDDEADRLVERCIRSALPKSRSEGTCLGRARASRRTRRDRPKLEVSSESEGEEEARPAAEDTSAPQPLTAAVVSQPQPLGAPVEGTPALVASPAARAVDSLRRERSPAPADTADSMTTSQCVASGALVVAAALEMARTGNGMANSSDLTSSFELLDGVGPPSMMDSGASANGMLSHSSHGSHGGLSAGRSPLLPRRPSSNGRFVPELMRRAVGPHGNAAMQESLEGLSSMSSCQSNIDQVKPPSLMEEIDLENSIVSLDSLRSETVESRLAVDNLALLDPPTLFHQLTEMTVRRDTTLQPQDSESVGSDTELCGQEDLPLDPPELPLDPRSTEQSPAVARRRTARERRQASPLRYRTFTSRSQPGTSTDDTSSTAEATLTPGEDKDADSAVTEAESITLCASGADSVPHSGRRRGSSERYRTQTVEIAAPKADLERPSIDPVPSTVASLSHSELRQMAEQALQKTQPSQLPTPGRGLRHLAAEAQKAIQCLRTANRATDGMPEFPVVPPPMSRLPLRQSASASCAIRLAAPPSEHKPRPETDPETDSASESESEPEPEQEASPARSRPRIVKPGEETVRPVTEPEPEQKGIRGRRKPLYSAARSVGAGLKKQSPPVGRTPPAKPAAVKSTSGRQTVASVVASSRPVRGTKTTQLRQVISGGGATAAVHGARGSRSATPSPASSATSSPQLALRRFGSAGKAGVISRELPRPASSPAAGTIPVRAATSTATARPSRRPVSIPVAAQSLKLQQRPAWVGSSRPPRPAVTAGIKPVATAPAAVTEEPKPDSEPATDPPAPPPLVKQGTFTLDEPSQQLPSEEKVKEPVKAPAQSPAATTRSTAASHSRPPTGGSRLPPKSASAQPMTTPRSRIPKSPSCESSLTLRSRCSSQSPGGRRERAASPRRSRPLRSSASNSSISGTSYQAIKNAAGGGSGAERSASTSSVGSMDSPARQLPDHISTGKMAALWKRIEESRAKQDRAAASSANVDKRVWIRAGQQQSADANANSAAGAAGRRALTEGSRPAARLVFTPRGWRRMGSGSPAQSPTEPRPNATAVIPPFNYSPPEAASGASSATAATAPDNADKRKRKSGALLAS